eukprot:c16890_g1_i1.p1 GENE.c16890_g1_i1~~c16890_g1_i1.p1  ORF type:complete len:656 (+),score=117.31 c16890_g1_i1:228-1970(+)
MTRQAASRAASGQVPRKTTVYLACCVCGSASPSRVPGTPSPSPTHLSPTRNSAGTGKWNIGFGVAVVFVVLCILAGHRIWHRQAKRRKLDASATVPMISRSVPELSHMDNVRNPSIVWYTTDLTSASSMRFDARPIHNTQFDYCALTDGELDNGADIIFVNPPRDRANANYLVEHSDPSAFGQAVSLNPRALKRILSPHWGLVITFDETVALLFPRGVTKIVLKVPESDEELNTCVRVVEKFLEIIVNNRTVALAGALNQAMVLTLRPQHSPAQRSSSQSPPPPTFGQQKFFSILPPDTPPACCLNDILAVTSQARLAVVTPQRQRTSMELRRNTSNENAMRAFSHFANRLTIPETEMKMHLLGDASTATAEGEDSGNDGGALEQTHHDVPEVGLSETSKLCRWSTDERPNSENMYTNEMKFLTLASLSYKISPLVIQLALSSERKLHLSQPNGEDILWSVARYWQTHPHAASLTPAPPRIAFISCQSRRIMLGGVWGPMVRTDEFDSQLIQLGRFISSNEGVYGGDIGVLMSGVAWAIASTSSDDPSWSVAQRFSHKVWNSSPDNVRVVLAHTSPTPPS